ncbi:cobalamin synthase [Salinisphaera orenii YIM 95161]|uniref:Adenosylcobinamide-GDP ribazoletransferase n=1 Tax=Salinisphaera orenii YIM 95161 TaxID=1051139 RepID=A0A423PJL7_9GAMM|nr:adenosylcobinamide-GDP ribazoletransferase [Salinisphaera halophila]ROO25779.1 cobalamin synthase [Salinisphaera halophila YIM 95161]
MKRLQPFWLACALLTTLPVGPLVHTPVASRDSGRSVVCYPLVGLLIGLLVAGFAALLAGVHAGLAAVLTLAVWVALSGALHLDGLADCTDAWFAGHRDPERCLAVMRDPAAGPMAVVALVLLLLTKAAALTVLVGTGDALALVAAPVLARSGAAVLMATTAYRRSGGLATAMAAWLPRRATALAVAAVAVIGLFVVGPGRWLILLAAAIAAGAAWRGLWQRRIGGYTGDVVGGLIECVELAVVVAAALTV